MAVEIEKKYSLRQEQVDGLRERLRDAKAEFQSKTHEENVIYGGGVLDQKGAILRIRKTENRQLLTYKRRIENSSDAKRQIEHESEFTDVSGVEEILSELGFAPRLIYEKRRETWHFRSVEVVIDELPFGWFIEVEGSITAIKEAELLLDLDDFETVHETYPLLTAMHGVRVDGVVEARLKK